MDQDILNYYSQRAAEYEEIYDLPERQDELFYLKDFLKKEFAGMNIFEAACGTGYWTQIISETANFILATDAGSDVLSLARGKNYPNNNVTHILADVYTLDNVSGNFQGAFGGFIWSHIPLNSLNQFITSVNKKLVTGGKVVMIDNNYIEGVSAPTHHKDEKGNSYCVRRTRNGAEHIIIKNYPTEEEIRTQLDGYAYDIRFKKLEHYWILSYSRK